jgi:hypothetical protein
MMNCEEFELRGLDLDRTDADPAEAAEAAAHANGCARCNALLDSWHEVKSDLQLLREVTQFDSAPARVEMRLRQELQTQRESRVPGRVAVISAWALAAAAVLIGAVSWGVWQRGRSQGSLAQKMAVPATATQNTEKPETPKIPETIAAKTNRQQVQAAGQKKTPSRARPAVGNDEDAGKFTLLPGSLPLETDEAAIVRVRMQRGALGAFGFPVNQERAGEWIQVDLLVGNDGLPQAVRLAR